MYDIGKQDSIEETSLSLYRAPGENEGALSADYIYAETLNVIGGETTVRSSVEGNAVSVKGGSLTARHIKAEAGFDISAGEVRIDSDWVWALDCSGDFNISGGSLYVKPSSGGGVLCNGDFTVSGGPVKKLCDAYGIEPDHLIIIHDELDIDPGTVRVKFGGGHAGHNGLRSICDKLGTRDWYRLRCGIGRPPGRMDVADFVLSVPKKEAADDFAYAVDRAAQATLCLISEGLEKAQQQFN